MGWIKQIVRFILLVLLQGLLINNLHISGLCHPYIYILCLLVMPMTLPSWAELLIGFAAGLIMDMYSNSPGVHMAACTALMLARPYLIKHLIMDSERLTDEISLSYIGANTFSIYAAILIAGHHTLVFLLTNWFQDWLFMLGQIAVSSTISFGLIIGYEFIRKK